MSDDDRTRREGVHPRRPSTVTRLEGANAAASADYLARGSLVGRYVVLDVLGSGGMGVVYGAFDPELDRKVAIKLLQPREADAAGTSATSTDPKAWLVREAQALARLSHPNVVAVYDVGTLPGDGEPVFVAMELVDGVTLREWLKQRPRPWREALPVLVAAGQGLAAAHGAGLVHRDFKPDNVVVAHDGRARVMDFGLARLGRDLAGDDDDEPASRDSDLAIEHRSPLSEQLTMAGTVLGTPAYMAPEVYRGEPADPRSDQFSFGVTLFEALYRARPYKRADLAPPATARPPRLPTNASELGIPARVQRVVLRALAWDRDQRYPSMTELLADLRVQDGRKPTWVVAIGLGLVALAAVGGVYLMRGSHRELCKGADKRLAGVWDPAIEKQVETAFLATKKPFAVPAFAGVVKGLDRYTTAWTAAVTESCEATRVRGEQTEDTLSLREACLDNHLEEVRVMTGLLGQADAAMVEKGDKVVIGLDPLAECANVTLLRAPSQPPAAQREELAKWGKKIAEAKADLAAGIYLASLIASSAAIEGAKALGYEPMVAEARIVHGAALLTSANFPGASEDFREAVWAAIRGKRDDLAASADLSMALVTTDAGGRPSEAAIWLGHAEAISARLGPDENFQRRELEISGLIAAESGDFATAIAKHEKALAVAEAALPKESPGLLTDEINLATTYSRAGAYGKAAPHFEHAKALRAASVGLEHPDIALIESDLGAAYTHLGETAKARAAFESSLSIREKFYGQNSPLLVAPLDNFAELLRKQGDVEAALSYQERALTLCKLVPGVAHPMYHQLVTDYVDTLIAAKRFADAHVQLEAVFALEQANQSPTLPASQTARAELALAEAKPADADKYATLAIANYETTGGDKNPLLWRPLTALARARIAIGKLADAKPLLERALAIGKLAQISESDLAPTVALVANLKP
ncbi:MAG: serine/threonine-protein kinase [Kofleriaceae bacterium]